MANPQPTDSHIRIANEIETELLRSKFTQRQYSILRFILRLSWGCGKKTAVIPQLKDFELCGVLKTHIKAELEHLIGMKVITWNRHTNEFGFNKDYEQWRVTPAKGWDGARFKELLSINLATRNGYQNGNSVTDSDVTQLPKVEPSYQKNDVTQLPKVEPETGHNPCDDWILDPSITKEITSNDKEQQPLQPRAGVENLLRRFGEEFKAAGIAFSSFDREEIDTWLRDPRYCYSPDLIMRALKEAVLHKKVNVPYIDSILRGWKEKGWTTPEQVDAGQQQSQRKNTWQSDNVVRFPRPNPAQEAQDLIDQVLGRK